MGKPITTTSGGICSAFPNVCKTVVGPATVPIPYPSIGQLSSATGIASSVKAGGSEVVTKASTIDITTGDAAGQSGGGGVQSNTVGKKVEFNGASGSVFAEGTEVVRMFDDTKQNVNPATGTANAYGVVLGGFPSVLVGD